MSAFVMPSKQLDEKINKLRLSGGRVSAAPGAPPYEYGRADRGAVPPFDGHPQSQLSKNGNSARGGRISADPANPILEDFQPLTQGSGTPSDVRQRTDNVKLEPSALIVNKILESADGDWKSRLQSATSFQDIYTVFKETGTA